MCIDIERNSILSLIIIGYCLLYKEGKTGYLRMSRKRNIFGFFKMLSHPARITVRRLSQWTSIVMHENFSSVFLDENQAKCHFHRGPVTNENIYTFFLKWRQARTYA